MTYYYKPNQPILQHPPKSFGNLCHFGQNLREFPQAGIYETRLRDLPLAMPFVTRIFCPLPQLVLYSSDIFLAHF
jgi:hypothetical protein